MPKVKIDRLEEIFREYLKDEEWYGFDYHYIKPHLEVLLDTIKKEVERELDRKGVK